MRSRLTQLSLAHCNCLNIFIFSEYRDQGLTRPKVLIVLPFRESALRVVNIMISLLKSDDQVFFFYYIVEINYNLVLVQENSLGYYIKIYAPHLKGWTWLRKHQLNLSPNYYF